VRVDRAHLEGRAQGITYRFTKAQHLVGGGYVIGNNGKFIATQPCNKPFVTDINFLKKLINRY
jgi:hypothetical protein